MPVSASTMSRLLGRLTAAMGKPYSDATVERQAQEYARAMGQLPEYAVEWAVDVAIRELDRYPKAATLRKLAQQCPMLENGDHDQSLAARMQRWVADPFAEVTWTAEEARGAMRSKPCPVCESVMAWSPRGYVIVHDQQRHREAKVGYSNIGRTEWFDMGPPVVPTTRPNHPRRMQQRQTANGH
jgi:hypothetical protein